MGVREFGFDIDNGTGTLELAPGAQLDLEVLRSAAARAGFELAWTELEASGVVAVDEDDLSATVELPGQLRPLTILPAPDEAGRHAFQELVRMAKADRATIRVEGLLESRGGEVVLRLESAGP